MRKVLMAAESLSQSPLAKPWKRKRWEEQEKSRVRGRKTHGRMSKRWEEQEVGRARVGKDKPKGSTCREGQVG